MILNAEKAVMFGMLRKVLYVLLMSKMQKQQLQNWKSTEQRKLSYVKAAPKNNTITCKIIQNIKMQQKMTQKVIGNIQQRSITRYNLRRNPTI